MSNQADSLLTVFELPIENSGISSESVDADPIRCFESWSDELKSRSDRVRKLIGSAHWLSDGHHKEDLVRQFLCRHLPPRFRVTRGFLCTSDEKNHVSREIDIMVTDSEGELPWFSEGNLVITPPASALAQIHVKTKFDVRELADVLVSGAFNHRVFNSSVSASRLWFGAIFFDSSGAITSEVMRRVWQRGIKKASKTTSFNIADLPDCVAILDKVIFLPDKNPANWKKGKAEVRAYDCGKAAPAIFLSHFYESMVPTNPSKRRGEWFRMISKISNSVLFREGFPCHI